MSDKKQKVLDFIHTGVRCFDGAMGTALMKRGIPAGACLEMAEPEIIMAIHREYVEAGAQFITTNTFGGSRIKLNNFGLADKVLEINKRNTRLAREAAPDAEYFVVGDIGPTGEFIEPFGNVTFEQLYDVFSEQVEGLVDGGADAIIIETMIALDELLAAIKAAREHSDLPIIACMTFNKSNDEFRTMGGVDVPTAVKAMSEAGADVVGTNCTLTPAEMVGLVKKFRSLTDLPIIAEPNAGQPKLVDGQTVYDIGEHVEESLVKIIHNGANLVGGCCGTTPEYIRTLRQLIDDYNRAVAK